MGPRRLLVESGRCGAAGRCSQLAPWLQHSNLLGYIRPGSRPGQAAARAVLGSLSTAATHALGVSIVALPARLTSLWH